MSDSKTADFVVRLVGSNVKPWTVPLRSLARMMDAIQRLVEQKENEVELEDSQIEIEPQDGELGLAGSQVLRLVGVRSSSAGYAISTPYKDSTLGMLAATGRAILDPSHSEWTGPTISSVKDLSDVAKSLGVVIEIRQPRQGSRLGDVIARISPDTYQQVSDSAFVIGETSLYGTIERIGGASAERCAFRLPDQTKMIYCGVAGEDLARKLAKHLYEDVSIHGEATWLRVNWQIRSFRIQSFDQPKTGSIRDAMNEIWEAGGKAWDKVKNPDAYITEMRGA